MQKGLLLAGDAVAWLLNGAEREGITDFPEDAFPPTLDDDGPVIGTLSPTAKKLALNMLAANAAIARREAEIQKLDSISQLEAWRKEQRVMVKPAVDALNALIKAQVYMDLIDAGVDMKLYGGFVLVRGAKIIGLQKPTAGNSILDVLGDIFGRDVAREVLQQA